MEDTGNGAGNFVVLMMWSMDCVHVCGQRTLSQSDSSHGCELQYISNTNTLKLISCMSHKKSVPQVK